MVVMSTSLNQFQLSLRVPQMVRASSSYHLWIMRGKQTDTHISHPILSISLFSLYIGGPTDGQYCSCPPSVGQPMVTCHNVHLSYLSFFIFAFLLFFLFFQSFISPFTMVGVACPHVLGQLTLYDLPVFFSYTIFHPYIFY